MTRAALFPAVIVLALFAACSADGGGGSAAEPGDADYVPDGWETPSLSYGESAYLPAKVVDFKQAPGTYARDSSFRISGNQSKVLDFPDGGGTYAPNNDSLVSLGMAGGYVTLEFDPALANNADAADFIVYGNAYYRGGASDKVWQEPGTVWVMADANGDGLPNDTWYLLAPAYKNSEGESWTALTDGASSLTTVTYAKSEIETDHGSSWWPEESDSADSLVFDSVLVLSDSLYASSGTTPILRALADTAPTLIRGDLDGDDSVDGEADYPGLPAVYFYTVPDAPGDRTIDAESGGGAAMDLDWAVDPSASFSPVSLNSAKWVKIVSGTTKLNGTVGDYSCEVDAVVRALP